jgi:hypothetical protein
MIFKKGKISFMDILFFSAADDDANKILAEVNDSMVILKLACYSGSVDLNDAKKIAEAFLFNLDTPLREQLQREFQLVEIDAKTAKLRAISLMTEGLSLEVPLYDGNNSAANNLLSQIQSWLGNSHAIFTNVLWRNDNSSSSYPVFRGDDWSIDEGFVFVSSNRLGLLWFFGND